MASEEASGTRLLKPGVRREPAASHTTPVPDPVLGLSAWPGQMWTSSGSPSSFLPSPLHHRLSRDLESSISQSSRGWSGVPVPFRVTPSPNAGAMLNPLLSHLSGQQGHCQGTGRPVRFLFAHSIFFFKSDLKIRFPVKTWISGFRTRWEVSAPPRAAAGWRPRSLAGSCVRPWAAVPTAPRPLTPTASLCSCPWCRGRLGGLTTGCGSRPPGLGDSCFQGTPLDPAGEPVSRTAPCACA